MSILELINGVQILSVTLRFTVLNSNDSHSLSVDVTTEIFPYLVADSALAWGIALSSPCLVTYLFVGHPCPKGGVLSPHGLQISR